MPATWRFSGAHPAQLLQQLAANVRNKEARIAMNKAAAPVKAAVVNNAPSDTGSLKKSIRIKVKSYGRGLRWVAVIGPKGNFKRKGKRPAYYNRQVNDGNRYIRGRQHMDKAAAQTRNKFISDYIAALKERVALSMRR
jgi:HK97 gp10 family phage protein